MRALARHLQAVRDRSSDSLPRLDLPAVTRAHSWTFRCKPLMSNARTLAQLEKFARDINLRPCLLTAALSESVHAITSGISRSTLQISATPSAPRSKQGTPHHARVRGGSSSSDLKTTTGRDTNRAVGTGRSVEKATGRAAPSSLSDLTHYRDIG